MVTQLYESGPLKFRKFRALSICTSSEVVIHSSTISSRITRYKPKILKTGDGLRGVIVD